MTTPWDHAWVWDIETDGLLEEVSTIHSLCILRPDGSMISASSEEPGSIVGALRELQKAPLIVGHNIMDYDLRVLKKLHPWFSPEGVVRDTLLLAKMIWPADLLKDKDFPRWRRGALPGNRIGSHSLEAWGYRLGLQKGEYSATVKSLSAEYAKHKDLSKIDPAYHPLATTDERGTPRLDPWAAWNRPMQDYCELDVRVNAKLLGLIRGHIDGTSEQAMGIGWSEDVIDLEHRVMAHCLRQEERGFGYDLPAAIRLTAALKDRQAELGGRLVGIFGSWHEPDVPLKRTRAEYVQTGELPKIDRQVAMPQYPNVTVRRVSEKTGKELKPYEGPPLCHYYADAPFVRFSYRTFDPKNRRDLGDRLQAVFGWVPAEFGGAKGDQAVVDETTIRSIEVLPADIRETILEFLVVSKVLGQLADGSKAWNNLVTPDGRIHGRVDPLGTVSHRAAHKDPNLGQVPSVSTEEIKDEDGKVVSKKIIEGWPGGFGAECRALFKPGNPRMVQTGSDASGLELRLFGHYLHPFDGGEFARRVSTPGLDIHQENAKVTGLSRAATKTVTYAFLYGAGLWKLGFSVGCTEEELATLPDSGAAKQYLRFIAKKGLQAPSRLDLAYIIKGQEVKKKFMQGIVGLGELQTQLKTEAEKYGFIRAIDGRKLFIRKPHATLNQALQGGGAIVCKRWMLNLDALLVGEGLTYGQDYAQMAWVHDELQFEHLPGHTDLMPALAEEAMKITARELGFLGELATDSKSGRSWRECH